MVLLSLLQLTTCFALAGCRTCEHVETELRRREQEVRELREHLEHSEALNEAMLRELGELRRLCGRPAVGESVKPGTPDPVQPDAGKQSRESARPGVLETVTLPSTISQITLGRGTGGINQDQYPGDDALQIIVEPRDADGHSIKVPGCLQVAALEILPEGLKRPLSSWEVSDPELRRTWKSGLFSTGYWVVLPWQSWPCVEKLRVVVQFRLADGRLFEADKDIAIRLPPVSQRKAPHEPEMLPAPRIENKKDTTGWRTRKSTPAAVQPASWRELQISTGVQLLPPLPLK